MSIGINDNISTLYQLQQEAIYHSANKKISSAPENNISTGDNVTRTQKIGTGVCVAAGVAAALMVLSKFDKSRSYSINPLKMLKGGIKNTYIANAKYKTAQIVTIGTGSIIGGLAGGAIFDKKQNFQSKLREGIVQIANITFPIALVELLSICGEKFSNKAMHNWCKSPSLLKQSVTKFPPALGAMAGLVIGMNIANKCSNKLNEKIFHKKDDRPIKWKDFSAHVDDIGVAATFVAPDNFITKAVSRLIPAALLVAGYETGIKKETE